MGRELKAGKGNKANSLKSNNNKDRFILIADRGLNNHWYPTPSELNKTYIITKTTGWDVLMTNTDGYQIGDWIRIILHPDSSVNIAMQLDNSYTPTNNWNSETVIFVGVGAGNGGSSFIHFS